MGIEFIDLVDQNQACLIQELNLAHNKLRELDGIEQFIGLIKLDVAYNEIGNPKEFLRIPNKDRFESLTYNGNPG